MKVILAALNAKYIHSNLAVHCLRAYCRKYEKNLEIAEYTINNKEEAIIRDLYTRKPDVIAFSCYIWNINMIFEIVCELRKVMPNVKIWLGGPEVSYDAKECLTIHPEIDGIMVGEGEQTLLELMEYYVEKSGLLEDVKGIAYHNTAKHEFESKVENQVYETLSRPPINLSDVPYPYDDLSEFENKIIYYESSRGCPYSCSYCLSSIDKKVRFRDIELVKKELAYFLEYGVKQVKFIDRTFNCKQSHTLEIWKYILENDNGITNFHFEISADILTEEEINVLSKMRPGLVQLEVGVQSTNEKTIEAIRRKIKFQTLREKVLKVNESNNVHQHLDLIVGLPYEDYSSFGESFNDVYALQPNQLQIGFLKVLKGSYMYEVAKEYGIVSKDKAPYEVLYTNWLTFEEVLRLKEIEEMVEVYYNSGQFVNSITYLAKFYKKVFHLYEDLAKYYLEKGLFERSHSRIQRYDLLFDFYKAIVLKRVEEQRKHFNKEKEIDIFSELLTFDCYLREKMKSKPKFVKENSKIQECKQLYRKVLQEVNIGKEKEEKMTSAKIGQVMHIEPFTIDVEQTAKTGNLVEESCYILFDYSNRNPINYAASIKKILD